MRLDQDSGFAHFVFLQSQNLLQTSHLLALLLKQIMDGIHFKIAGLKTLQSVTDRHLLGSPHQNWLIDLIFGA